uniref:Reverse transcriptase domain-containing protein n=1 Tax=Tanacetum cinerariifolium TaxID=118510 RepID=A0A6L2K2S9_TANCI|nr:reverse transcriptase domain-containing protein [Tanacetum cinerariifolium]
MEITATIDGKVKVVTEAFVRRHLKLEDSDGISILPTTEIFEQLTLMGYVSNSDKLTFPKGTLFPLIEDLVFQGEGSIILVKSYHTPTCAPSTLPPYLSSPPMSSIRHETEVKKLEKTVKSNKARRKAKIVESDEEVNLEDPSKHGRSMIEKIDQDVEVTLVTHTQVSTQGEAHNQEDQPEDQLGVLSIAKCMQTRSSSRLVSNPSSNPTLSTNPNLKGRNRRHSKQRIKEFNLDELSPLIVTMADQRTMAQLLQAPTEGYEDAIVVPAIIVDNFELKHGLLTLVQNKHPDLDGEEPPRLIFTWDDLVSKFINQFFPPSKTTNLRNEITNFQQHFDESFSEAWDRLKDLLRACPHHGVSKEDFLAYVKANDAVTRNMQTQGQNMQNQLTNITELITKFVNSNSASTLSSGTLPSNTIANPRSDLKTITTQSGVSYNGPQIPPPPSFLPQEVGNKPEATKHTVHPTNNESTEDIQPQGVQSESLILTSEPVTSLISEPVIAPVSAPKPNPKSSIPYPSRRNDKRNREKANNQIEKFYQIFKDMSFEISFVDALILMPKFALTLKALFGNKEKLSEMARTPLNEHCSAVLLKKLLEKLRNSGKSFLKTGRALIDVFKGELTLRVGKEAITFNLDQTSRYSANYSDMTAKRIDVIDMACEEYSQEVLGFMIDFLLEEVDAFLAIEDDPTSLEVDQSYLDPEGGILLLEAFLNDDPSLPPPTKGNYLPEVRKELKICEAKSDKSSIDEPLEVELKDLPSHLEYAFLEGDDKLPVVIAKDLSM